MALRHSFRPKLDVLEARTLLSVMPLPEGPTVQLSLIARPLEPSPSSGIQPAASSQYSPPYSPAVLRHAYGVDQLGSGLNGSGQTIAIVDAFDDPTIASDLNTFDQKFGLPAATFIKSVPKSGTPAYDSGWAVEISLDVEWAHAIAPGATILLVEAASNSTTDLYTAVDSAVAQGANEVSMSWGGSEYSGETGDDSHFNHPGVTFLASSGDNGAAAGVGYPAASPYVTGVGGTTLTLDSSGNYSSEKAWSGSGGGISSVELQPGYQKGFYSSKYRGVPDVSYDADPSTGVQVYDSSGSGWYTVGGTSAGAPQWAGLIAIANGGRVAAGQPTLGSSGSPSTNQVLYQLAGSGSYTNPNGDFHDIASGSNGYPAKAGYDLATGLGSPVANKLIPDLINFGAPSGPPAVGDAGFEQVPVVGGYAYAPSGSAWAFSNASGVTGNGSGFTSGNPPAPQGTQVAFLQGTGSITQSVSGWAAGSYAISFDAALRGNYGGVQNFEVLVDGNLVGSFEPTTTSYQSYTTGPFTVAAGSHTIEFLGVNTAGGDDTDFLDAVAVAAAPAVTAVGDTGFEQVPVVGGYAYAPSGSAWAFSNASGVTGNGSGFTSGNPPAPQGTQVAFLQGTGSITQSVSGWAAGSYAISFDAALRGNYGGVQNFEVLVDGNLVGSFEPTTTSYQSYTTGPFTVAAGSHTIEFLGVNTAGGDDTDFLDAVAVASA